MAFEDVDAVTVLQPSNLSGYYVWIAFGIFLLILFFIFLKLRKL